MRMMSLTFFWWVHSYIADPNEVKGEGGDFLANMWVGLQIIQQMRPSVRPVHSFEQRVKKPSIFDKAERFWQGRCREYISKGGWLEKGKSTSTYWWGKHCRLEAVSKVSCQESWKDARYWLEWKVKGTQDLAPQRAATWKQIKPCAAVHH